MSYSVALRPGTACDHVRHESHPESVTYLVIPWKPLCRTGFQARTGRTDRGEFRHWGPYGSRWSFARRRRIRPREHDFALNLRRNHSLCGNGADRLESQGTEGEGLEFQWACNFQKSSLNRLQSILLL